MFDMFGSSGITSQRFSSAILVLFEPELSWGGPSQAEYDERGLVLRR